MGTFPVRPRGVSVAVYGEFRVAAVTYSETRLTTNYHDVAVLSGPTLVDLSLVGLQIPDPDRGLTILVRDAMARAD